MAAKDKPNGADLYSRVRGGEPLENVSLADALAVVFHWRVDSDMIAEYLENDPSVLALDPAEFAQRIRATGKMTDKGGGNIGAAGQLLAVFAVLYHVNKLTAPREDAPHEQSE